MLQEILPHLQAFQVGEALKRQQQQQIDNKKRDLKWGAHGVGAIQSEKNHSRESKTMQEKCATSLKQ